jgi:hypothetical protein
MQNHQILSQIGRSMIEMLGVLAIIGVLSVGAIAGYSKAMNKYRLNKFLNDSAFVLRTLLNNKDAVKAIGVGKDATRGMVASYLKALNAVPGGWSFKSNNMLYDNVGGHYDLFILTNDDGNNALVADYYYDHANEDICLSWMTYLLRPFDNIYFVWMAGIGIIYYGQDYCNGSSKACFSQASLPKLKDYCTQCDKNSGCYLAVRFT